MKGSIIFFLVFLFIVSSSVVMAQEINVKIAGDDEVQLLKKDLAEGKVIVGKTRLKEIQENYGKANSIKETEDKLVYNYGGLTIQFDKYKYLKKWEYDYSYGAAYTDDIDNLRADLEDGQLEGDLITFKQIRKDYDEPTKDFSTVGDGKTSIYFYGEIKLTFENVILIKSWDAKNFVDKEEILVTN